MRFVGCPDRRAGAAGFTLIEVVVALAILALALGAVFPQFSSALRLGAAAVDQRMAVLTARSALDELTGEPGLTAGTYGGRSPSGLRWTAEVAEVPVRSEPTRGSLLPLTVDLSVLAADGRSLVTLTTVALGRGP